MKIECPKCGADGEVAIRHGPAANDDENPLTFVPPEGFRKVQVGVFGHILLCCVRCGVPAERVTGDPGAVAEPPPVRVFPPLGS